MTPSKSETRLSASGSLPNRNFVQASHTDAADTSTSLSKDASTEWARRDSRRSQVTAQIKACVSTRTRIIRPKVLILLQAEARRTPAVEQTCPSGYPSGAALAGDEQVRASRPPYRR